MRKSALVLFTVFSVVTIQAQQAIVTSGGEASGYGGSSSYSVGQILYNSTTSTDHSISEGVQQSFEISRINNEETASVNLSAMVLPNPTSEFVVLTINDENFGNLSYTLNDVYGKMVGNASINLRDTPISMIRLATGIYILRVYRQNKTLITFKIIKN